MGEISLEQARGVARLARLALSDEQLHEHAQALGAVLGYVDRLRQLDLAGVEPMTSPVESVNRLEPDEPGAMLNNEQLMAIAPRDGRDAPFIKVPKVIGGGDGA